MYAAYSSIYEFEKLAESDGKIAWIFKQNIKKHKNKYKYNIYINVPHI